MPPRWNPRTSLTLALLAAGCDGTVPSSGTSAESSTTSTTSTTSTSGSTARPDATSPSATGCDAGPPFPPVDRCEKTAPAGAQCDTAGAAAREPGTCQSASYGFTGCDGGTDIVTYLACIRASTSSTTEATEATFTGFPDASGGDGGEYFACGADSCDRFTSFCIAPGEYSPGYCSPVPDACVSNVTCSCIVRYDAGDECAPADCSDTHGQLTVGCF